MSGDEDLLARAKRGDRAAFGALVRVHQRRVHATALHIMGSHAEADDVTQDVFIRAFRALASFDGRSDLFTWLYRITVNTSLNHLRKHRRNQGLAREGERRMADSGQVPGGGSARVRSPREEAELGQHLSRVLEALAELSETLRVTLVLATVEGLSYRDVSEILEVPEGTVAWRINEARRQLRERLAGADEPLAEPSGSAPAKKTLEEPGS